MSGGHLICGLCEEYPVKDGLCSQGSSVSPLLETLLNAFPYKNSVVDQVPSLSHKDCFTQNAAAEI